MRSRRLASLRAAVLLAAGFVGLRVLYRIVFGGAGGGGVLIVDLPRVRLAGPFEHITLFGPVSTGGVATAAASALPFAAVVLAFGLLGVIVDFRALLARGAVRGPVRTVSRALVVAWATFPALIESVRRVRVARELRGVRGPASLIVPILEQTVERAVALGASMEVRGFAATRRAEPDCEAPAVARDAALGLDGEWILEGVDFTLAPASLTLVAGPTGSGKSTLLHSLSGLFQHLSGGQQRGTIEVAGIDRSRVPPRDTAGIVGVVSQSVRLSFVAATVSEELGFALAMRQVAPVIISARVDELSTRLGIHHLLDRGVSELSAGEACLVAIGAAVIESPVLLLVDEPLADLDTDARIRVVALLDELAHEAGVCVVVAEHALPEWRDVPDAWFELGDGSVNRVPALKVDVGGNSAPARARSPHGSRVLDVSGISVRHGQLLAVDEASLVLHAGEIVALQGANGAGKSTLLDAIARPTRAGVVLVDGADVHGLTPRVRRLAVAFVPESFDDMLFAISVAEECRQSDHGSGDSRTVELFARFCGASADRLSTLLSRHPRDLSSGERLCLVLAIQLAAQPRVLLVDEPSRGLDAEARRLVGAALSDAAASGAAIMMATHDHSFAAAYSTRIITMRGGRVTSGARVSP